MFQPPAAPIFFIFSPYISFIIVLHKVLLPVSLFVSIVEDVVVMSEETLLELSMDKTNQGLRSYV